MGGGEFSLFHLARLLDPKIKPLFLFARPGSFSRRLESMGIETMMLAYAPVVLSRFFLPLVFLKNFRAAFSLARLIRERRIDLVHCTDLFSLLLLLPAFLQTRIPIVYNVIMFYNEPQRRLFRILAPKMTRRVVAPSRAVRDDLVHRIGLRPETVEVLSPGVDITVFTPPSQTGKEQSRKKLNIPSGTKVIGCAARYDAGKGHKTLLDAITLLANSKFQNRPRTPVSLSNGVSGGDFERPVMFFDGIIEQNPKSEEPERAMRVEGPNPNHQSPITNHLIPISNLQCFLAGGSPTEGVVTGVKRYREELEPSMQALEQKGALRRLGHIEKMSDFYHALDLFVCPSDAEGFGLVVLEAFAAGLPIVVTKTTGAVEVVKEAKGVYVVEPGNPEAMAKAIATAVRKGSNEVNPEERRTILKECTWEKYAEGWEAIYKHQIKNSK